MKWFVNLMIIFTLLASVEVAEARFAKKLGKGLGRSVKFAKDSHQGAIKFGKKQKFKRQERIKKRKDRRKQRREDFKSGFAEGQQ
jgi:hypothetical protein